MSARRPAVSFPFREAAAALGARARTRTWRVGAAPLTAEAAATEPEPSEEKVASNIHEQRAARCLPSCSLGAMSPHPQWQATDEDAATSVDEDEDDEIAEIEAAAKRVTCMCLHDALIWPREALFLALSGLWDVL